MPVKEDVPEDVAIGLQERIEDFPGMSIEVDWQRVYPYAPLASHVLGYMGAITAEDADHFEALGYDTSSQGEDVGRSGVEQSMEQRLHGRWGQRTYEIDARNRIVRTISYTPPVSGEDIQLSIDLDLQYYAERLLITQLESRRQPSLAGNGVQLGEPQGLGLDPWLAEVLGVCRTAPQPEGLVQRAHRVGRCESPRG